MSFEYASPVIEIKDRMNKMLNTEIDFVSFIRGRKIQCIDGAIIANFDIPRKVPLSLGESADSNQIVGYTYELSVVIDISEPSVKIPKQSSFNRTVSADANGVSIAYTLFGATEIKHFLSRLPYRLPYTSVTHVVQKGGYMKMASFLQHLDCGDSWYSCVTVDNYVRDLVKDQGLLMLRIH